MSKACADEIFKTQVEGAHDYRTDVKLHAACKLDAKQCCPNVEPEEGRVQDCLVRACSIALAIAGVRGWTMDLSAMSLATSGCCHT